MGLNIVAITIDKVQTFIYHTLDVNIQQNETDNGTLNKVIHSSEIISGIFFEDIGLSGNSGKFKIGKDDILLECSGMCVFLTKLTETEVIKKLDQLFQEYYISHKGQLLLKYVCFQENIETEGWKIRAIKQGKRRLMDNSCLNSIIERNANVLFAFPSLEEMKEASKKQKLHNLKMKEKALVYDGFVKAIDELDKQEDISESEASQGERFRTVVIKADLDGMGELFEQIKNFDTYKLISELLLKCISIDFLHDITKEVQIENKDFKLYPLYIAGDDIFFAVPVSQIIAGVNVCRNILGKINEKIKGYREGDRLQSDLGCEALSMSIGIDFTINKEPIRYYYERVQSQMEMAKKAKSLKSGKEEIKIAIQNYVFYSFDSELCEENKELPKWNHFLHDIKCLNYMKSCLKDEKGEEYELHHFFYSLLGKLTPPETYKHTLKYSTAFLYHLLPRYLGNPNKNLQETELRLLESIVGQALVKKEKQDEGKYEKELKFEDEQKKKIITFIRLLLLFTDDRFKIVKPQGIEKLQRRDTKRIRSSLFNKTLRYLYNNNFKNSDEAEKLRNIFINKDYYESDKCKEVWVYQTLDISTSMFMKLRNKNRDVALVGEMLDALLNQDKLEREQDQEIKGDQEIKKDQEIKEDKKKLAPFKFNKDAFCNISSETWKECIDPLMVFYKLNELSIQYKTMYSPPKKNSNPDNSLNQKKSYSNKNTKGYSRK